MIEKIEERYQLILKEQAALAADRQQRARKMPWVRGGLFVAVLVLLIVGLTGDLFAGWWLLAAALFGGFLSAVRHHRRLIRDIEDAQLFQVIGKRGLDRLHDRWGHFAQRGERYALDDHAYAQDLDIFGQSSLFQLLHTMQTRFGEDTLAAWLKARASREEIERRQGLVADLMPRLLLRQSLEREGMRLHLNEELRENLHKENAALESVVQKEVELPDPTPFLRWAEGEPILKGARFLRLWIVLSPIFLVTTFLLQQLGLISALWWLLPLLGQLVLSYGLAPKIMPILASVSFREKLFSLYASMFQVIEEERCEKDTPFGKLQEELRKQGDAPHRAMGRLQFLIDLIDVRYAALLHFPLNLIFFWDLHCLFRLEAWQERNGRFVRSWLDRLGEIEALCALATFADEHPEASFPILAKKEEPLVFDAKELSHPLLARKGRVANDLKLHHDSPMILLTGSNMSGKSTLLRTLGINAVLAYAGSMVCAKKLRLSEHLQVATSMRIKDSLEHGISFFMAELYRLKRILDMREKADPIFYLLDEMLHGTNTLERRIAALGIIAQLLDSPAIGAVSTHDMEVSEKCSRFAPRIRFAYLSDQITDRQMRFDYKLREGICPTTNALKLLEIVGIALPEEAKTW